MFRAAQWVVRHKVLVVGVGAAAWIFAGGGNKEPVKPANPWAAGASEQVQLGQPKDKGSFTDKAIHVVSGGVKKVTGMDIEEVKETNTQNWAAATDATKKANGSN